MILFQWTCGFADGHSPKVCPGDASLVAFGGGGFPGVPPTVRIMDWRTNRVLLETVGRSIHWIRETVATWVVDVPNNNEHQKRWEFDVISGVSRETGDDPALVGANEFSASHGDWASYHSRLRRVVVNGRVLGQGEFGGVSVSAGSVLTVRNNVEFEFYDTRSFGLKRKVQPGGLFNAWRNYFDIVTHGYIGETFVAFPTQSTSVPCGVTPWHREGVTALTASEERMWAAVSTEVADNTSEKRVAVFVHPQGDSRVFPLWDVEMVAPDLEARNGKLILAGASATGQLKLFEIDESAVLQPVSWPLDRPFTRPMVWGGYHRFPVRADWPLKTIVPQENVAVVSEKGSIAKAGSMKLIVPPELIDEVTDPAQVIALIEGNEGSADQVDAACRAMRKAWATRFPSVAVPAVVCYLQPKQVALPNWPPREPDVFCPQIYFDSNELPERIDFFYWHAFWLKHLMTDRPWMPVIQTFDRSTWSNDAMVRLANQMGQVIALSRAFNYTIGFLCFAVNRPGGIVRYPELFNALSRVAFTGRVPAVPPTLPSKPMPVRPEVSMSYAPALGTEPMRVGMAAIVLRGSFTNYEWMARMDNDPWMVLARTSTPSYVHTFPAGTFYLKLRANGPAGTAETQAERRVVVYQKASVPMPPSKKIHTSFRTSDGVHFLCSDRDQNDAHGNTRVNATRTTGDLGEGIWEAHDFLYNEDGTISVQDSRGQFWHQHMGGDRNGVYADRSSIDVHEKWNLRLISPTLFALESVDKPGQFLTAEGGGGSLVTVRNPETSEPWGAWQVFESTVALTGVSLRKTRGRISARGKDLFYGDGGHARLVFASLLTALAPGRWESAMALARDYAAMGVMGVRVFVGSLLAMPGVNQRAVEARKRLKELCDEMKKLGMYVLVTCITDSALDNYNLEEHVQFCGAVCAECDNTILEVANEPYHETQRKAVNDFGYLRRLAALVPADVLVGLGAASDDESVEGRDGEYIPVHLDRGRDMWNEVRRVRESQAVEDLTGDPAFIQESTKAAPIDQEGRFENSPEWWWTFGVNCRIFEIEWVIHSQCGLECTPLDDVTRACIVAGLRGFYAIPLDVAPLIYKNAGHNGSPVKDANFKNVTRTYSGITGSGGPGWTILEGIALNPDGSEKDPGVQWNWKRREEVDRVSQSRLLVVNP